MVWNNKKKSQEQSQCRLEVGRFFYCKNLQLSTGFLLVFWHVRQLFLANSRNRGKTGVANVPFETVDLGEAELGLAKELSLAHTESNNIHMFGPSQTTSTQFKMLFFFIKLTKNKNCAMPFKPFVFRQFEIVCEIKKKKLKEWFF